MARHESRSLRNVLTVLVAVTAVWAGSLTPRVAARAPVPPQAGKPLPPELALVPHDAASVVTARPRAILTRFPVAARERAEVHIEHRAEEWLTSVLMGVALDDIERFTVITPPDALPPVPENVKDARMRPVVDPDPPGVFAVPPEVRSTAILITTRRPLARLPYRLPGSLAGGSTFRTGRTGTHRGRTFDLDDDGWTAWLKVGDRTAVIGSRASVEWVIDWLTGHAKPGPLEHLIRATRDHDFAALVRTQVGQNNRPSDFLAVSTDVRARTLAKGIENWLTSAREEPTHAPDAVALGADLSIDRIELHAAYPTEQAAEQHAEQFSVLRKGVLELAAQARRDLAQNEAGDERRRDADRLDTMAGLLKPLDKPTASGRVVSAELSGLARPTFADHNTVRLNLRCLFTQALPLSVSYISSGDVNLETYREARIASALGAYHAKHGRYPDAAVADKDGKPLLSWRVALLPHLGYEDLYTRFKLDEPWDSPHNAKLLDEIPWPYSDGDSRRLRHRPTTRVYLPVGPGTLFEGGTGRRKADATDGADQTVLFLKLDRSVPWTKPVDAVVAPGKPLTISGARARVHGITTADGKPRDLNLFACLGGELDLAPLLTRSGGEPKRDIGKTISDAALAAGHDKLDTVKLYQRVFKTAGVEIPATLSPPSETRP